MSGRGANSVNPTFEQREREAGLYLAGNDPMAGRRGPYAEKPLPFSVDGPIDPRDSLDGQEEILVLSSVAASATTYPFRTTGSVSQNGAAVDVAVTGGSVFDYSQSLSPSETVISKGEFTVGEGTHLIYVLITVDVEEGKAVLSATLDVHHDDLNPEVEENEIAISIAEITVISESGKLAIESIKQIQAGSIYYNPRPVWAEYDPDDKKLTIGAEESDGKDSPVKVEDIDLRVVEPNNGGNLLRVFIENNASNIELGDLEGSLQQCLKIGQSGMEGLPQIMLQTGVGNISIGDAEDQGYGISATHASSGDLGALVPGRLFLGSGANALDVSAGDISGLMSVKTLSHKGGTVQIIATDDVDIEDPEPGGGGGGDPAWANYSSGNLEIGGANTDGVGDFKISSNGYFTLDITDSSGGDIRYTTRGIEGAPEFGMVFGSKAAGIIMGGSPAETGTVFVSGGAKEAGVSENGFAAVHESASKKVDINIDDIPAESEAKFREVLVCDGDTIKHAHFLMTEPKEVS
jgi:hypothetical protein